MIVPLHDLNRYITVSGGGKDGRARFEHVAIAEKALGRKLPKTARVHHLNGVKSDNRNQNLVICENESYHQLLHRRFAVYEAGGDPNTQAVCSKCGLLRSQEDRHCSECTEKRNKENRDDLLTFSLSMNYRQREYLGRYADIVPIYDMDKHEIDSLLGEIQEEDFIKVEEWLMSTEVKWGCRYPDCRKVISRGAAQYGIRGLCIYHYGIANRLVKRGKTTWETLEAHGKSIPARPGGSPDLEAQAYFLNDEDGPSVDLEDGIESEVLPA